MNIAYFPNQTALQSEPVWRAFLEGCQLHGITAVENSFDADAAVIWSVLWQGRMRSNQQVYNHYRSQGKPVFIIEVGALKRRVTWKISLNNITANGIYPNQHDLDVNRPEKLGLKLFSSPQDRKSSILIATQHQSSLQWEGLPTVDQWIEQKIREIRLHTDRLIVIRPHPRCPIRPINHKDVSFELPNKIPNTYDEYDINYNYHCVVNHCSGPSIQSPIYGTPIICDQSSLAFPVSTPLCNIENPDLPNREDWFIKICHTEWTIDEISSGIPQKYLLQSLTLYF